MPLLALYDTYLCYIWFSPLFIYILPENVFSWRPYNSISPLSVHFVLLFPGYTCQEKEFPVCNRQINSHVLLRPHRKMQFLDHWGIWIMNKTLQKLTMQTGIILTKIFYVKVRISQHNTLMQNPVAPERLR